MEEFDSISHFIQSGGFEYRVFDMGRKVFTIDNRIFEELEGQKQAYPYPFQQKAWLALLIWQEGKQQESTVWFLQFPIDELGFLKQESRDGFLIELLRQTGKNIQAKQKGGKVLDELDESPFAFKPAPNRLAIFHALATRELHQAYSQYYQHAHDYLTGETGFEQWQFLGLQGVADIVTRLDQDDNNSLLANAIAEMPDIPLETFSHALENIAVDAIIFNALIHRLTQELEAEESNVSIVAALVRGISGGTIEQKEKILQTVLTSSVGVNIEVLAAISGRSWVSLQEVTLLITFIDNLAIHEQASFNAIVADLMMIPGMRDHIFAVMKRPNRSAVVSQKLGGFMKAIGGSVL